jgi:hypothetical protein
VFNPQFSGYSIGKWLDTTGEGSFDVLEVETRNMRGTRLFDSSGIPLHGDNETIIEERIYLDKSDPNILRNEITTFDHALARPWTVSRFYRRGLNPVYEEYPCTEDNHWIAVGLSIGQRRLSHADSEESAAARSKVLPKIFRPDEAVTGVNGNGSI